MAEETREASTAAEVDELDGASQDGAGSKLVELSFDEIDESYLTQSAMLCQIS